MHNLFLLFCILNFALCIGSCSIPSLEKPECTQARDNVRQFYSWYLGTDAEARAKQPEIFQKFISAAFLTDTQKGETDPYFLTNNFPKTFRLGACRSVDAEKVEIQVQLFWRDEASTVQKEVHVETIKTGDGWQINKVSN